MYDYDLVMALEKRIQRVYAEQGLKSLRFGHHQTSGTAFHDKHMEAILDREAMEAIMD